MERKRDMKKQSEWSNAYTAKAYDRISVFIPKGEREVWKQYAKERGMTLNKLVVTAVSEYIGDLTLPLRKRRGVAKHEFS